MDQPDLIVAPLFRLGPVVITTTVVTTWALMAVLVVVALSVTRRLKIEPGPVQTAVEGAVTAIEAAIAEVAPSEARMLLPFIGTLWIFLTIANLSGVIPEVHSPTRDLSATAALAVLVFFSTHWFGIRIEGVRRYLKHYLTPSPLLLPFHLISEITRTVALAFLVVGVLYG